MAHVKSILQNILTGYIGEQSKGTAITHARIDFITPREGRCYEGNHKILVNESSGSDMSRHSFDPEIAKRVGLNAATIYQNIVWWAEKNAANEKHYYDGRYWTYNSVAAFGELFPYLTTKQIRTALSLLGEHKLVLSGCYNKSLYDRTRWYSPICLVGQKGLPSAANLFALSGKPIPVINTVINTDSNIEGFPDWIPIEAWKGWVEMREQRKRPLTDRATTRAIKKLEALQAAGHDITELLDRSTISGWLDIYEPKGMANAGNNKHSAEPTNAMVRAVFASQARRATAGAAPPDDWS